MSDWGAIRDHWQVIMESAGDIRKELQPTGLTILRNLASICIALDLVVCMFMGFLWLYLVALSLKLIFGEGGILFGGFQDIFASVNVIELLFMNGADVSKRHIPFILAAVILATFGSLLLAACHFGALSELNNCLNETNGRKGLVRAVAKGKVWKEFSIFFLILSFIMAALFSQYIFIYSGIRIVGHIFVMLYVCKLKKRLEKKKKRNIQV